MKRRFVAVIVIGLAVLFCQSGGVVLAAICPHLRATHQACHGMIAPVESHETQTADAFETSDSGATCNHCVVPLSNKRDDSALQEANSAQRANDLAVSLPQATPHAPALAKTIRWVANAHGPPRDAGSLYVLINVFRI